MYEDVIKIVGQASGSVSIVIAGVHGDESCGVEAFSQLLPHFTIDNGTVFFAYGNPRAIQKNVRFDEFNLNRLFKDDDLISDDIKASYEYGRAQQLKVYMDKSSAMLDIHASSIKNSRIFAICEPNSKDIVCHLPTDLIVSGFDDIEPGGTDGYMNSNGKIGICLECGFGGDPISILVAIDGIFSFLRSRGHINDVPMPIKHQNNIRVFHLHHSKTDSFKLAKNFENFEKVAKGQLIGTDGIEEVCAPKKCVILFAHNREAIGSEVFLLCQEKKPWTVVKQPKAKPSHR